MADDDNTRPVDPAASTEDRGKPSSTALPKKIGHYSIKNALGSGGMGHVYLAQQAPSPFATLRLVTGTKQVDSVFW